MRGADWLITGLFGITYGVLIARNTNHSLPIGALLGLILSPVVFHVSGFCCSILLGSFTSPQELREKSDAELGRSARRLMRVVLALAAIFATVQLIGNGPR
jgi:hypothetical protein